MKIKSKLLTYIGGLVGFLLFISFYLIISLTTNEVTTKLDNQLKNQTESLTKQVTDLIVTSSRTYLSAIGISALNTTKNYKELIDEGSIEPEKAMELIKKYLTTLHFLNSGVVFIVDNNGRIMAHPEKDLIGTYSPMKSWLDRLSIDQRAYKDYFENGKYKTVYRVYDNNFNFNICVSAFTSDFLSSVDMVELNKSMNNMKIGLTGYPFLIGENGVLLTYPDSNLVNKNVLNITDEDNNFIFKRVIQEKEGTFLYRWKGLNGNVLKKFIMFSTEPNSGLLVCVTGYIDEFFDTINIIKKIIIISGFSIALLLIVAIFFISSNVTKPLVLFTNRLKEISLGEGDLTGRILLKSSGEIGVMVKYFNIFLDNLQGIISSIKSSTTKTLIIKDSFLLETEYTSESVNKIYKNINEINIRTEDLYKNVGNSSNSVNKIDTEINGLHNSINMQGSMLDSSNVAIAQMIASIKNVSKITESKQKAAKKLIDRANDGEEVIFETINAVNTVSEKLQSVQNMASVISDIASQTNMLSMNAAIEAAHAGEAGKGFAVVADEIRVLAESARSNSYEISKVLKDIYLSMSQAENLSKKTSESYMLVKTEIQSIVQALTEIDYSTSELQDGGNEIIESISELEKSSEIIIEKTNSIGIESLGVKNSMLETKNVTDNVISSIKDINILIKEIIKSMNTLKTSSAELEINGNKLDKRINKFII